MVSLFRRRSQHAAAPRLHARGEPEINVNKVDFSELAPTLEQFLAQAAYLQLTVFETLAGAVAGAPDAESKEAVSTAAALSLQKHHGLIAEIARKRKDAAAAMVPYAGRIDDYRSRTIGSNWYETMVTSYVTAGLLDDFSRGLASGLPAESARRVSDILGTDDGHRLIADELRKSIEADPRLASKLAMWGRRLVGDTLLIARSSLAIPASGHADEARLEPVFTELIAAHTRRMDALGLTA